MSSELPQQGQQQQTAPEHGQFESSFPLFASSFGFAPEDELPYFSSNTDLFAQGETGAPGASGRSMPTFAALPIPQHVVAATADMEGYQSGVPLINQVRTMAKPNTKKSSSLPKIPGNPVGMPKKPTMASLSIPMKPGSMKENGSSSDHSSRKRKRSADLSELTLVGMFTDNGARYSRHIRKWKNERNLVFWDCVCGRRKAVHDLKKIKTHVDKIHRKELEGNL